MTPKLSVRLRLVLWYTGVLTFILILYSAAVFWSLKTELIETGGSPRRIATETGELLAGMFVGFPLALIAAAVGGYLLAGKALAPVREMTRRARDITAERLHERLPEGKARDEINELARTFNDTFARLERSFEQMRRFTADASHELRTPLTALRSVGEVALKNSIDEKPLRHAISSMLEECDRLRELVESLLTLSRADAGQVTLQLESFDVSALVMEVADQLEILAEEKDQRLLVETPGPISVRADKILLRQALVNVIDNAIKFAPPASSGKIRVALGDQEVILEICDEGPGIAPADIPYIFERFYRADTSRSRSGGSTGLGLAIAKGAVEANGGRIEVDPSFRPGTLFRITLPTLTTEHR